MTSLDLRLQFRPQRVLSNKIHFVINILDRGIAFLYSYLLYLQLLPLHSRMPNAFHFGARVVGRLIFVLSAFLGLFVGCCAAPLLVEVLTGGGSSTVNDVRIAAGLLLLFLSPLVFIVGIIFWNHRQSSPEDEIR